MELQYLYLHLFTKLSVTGRYHQSWSCGRGRSVREWGSGRWKEWEKVTY